jgi:NAD(P)-dependent dehydrogenase (short-subunit alcohol dehydrogenase family)
MELGLQDRVAVVTGAARGIGLAIAQALAAEGAQVVAGSRRTSPELEELVAAGSARVLEVDLSAAAGPAELVAFAGDRIDIVVNNVGSAPARTGGFLSVTDEMWQASLEIDLLAAVRTCRAALPVMIAAGGGSIVSISSVNAILADPNVVDYGAAKAALSNFCKSLSKEFGPHGIRVNTVSPGPVGTALWLGAGGVAETVARATGLNPAEVAAAAARDSVTGRFTTPQEVAKAVLFLAGDTAANITGADIRVDGGLVSTW